MTTHTEEMWTILKHRPFIKRVLRLKTMCAESILPPHQTQAKSASHQCCEGGSTRKMMIFMMNLGHVFVRTGDVENEANYRMNGKQLVATPIREGR